MYWIRRVVCGAGAVAAALVGAAEYHVATTGSDAAAGT